MKSPAVHAPSEEVSTANRSRVTNGSSVVLFGDGRSAGARRFRDVMAGLVAEVGGAGVLAESERQLARRAASTSIECELLEAERAAGKEVDPTRYATVLNAQRRAMKDFEVLRRKHQAAKPKGQGLRDYLATKTEAAPA